MANKSIAIGTYGNVSTGLTASGQYRASARYRRQDGSVVQRHATGPSAGAARRALKAVFETLETESPGRSSDLVRPGMTLAALVKVWHDRKLAEITAGKSGALRQQTLDEYIRLIHREVLDRSQHDSELQGLGSRAINTLTVQELEAFLLGLDGRHASQPRNVRAALSGPLKLAVRYGALEASPLSLTETFTKPKKEVVSLSAEQVPRFRELARRFGHEPGKPGPRNSRQLTEFVEVGLALALRPGELLALHWEDIDGLSTANPTVHIHRTVVHLRGRGLIAQPEPKSSSSNRRLPVPGFAAEIFRSRQATSTSTLVFPNRLGGVLSVTQYEKWLRACVQGTEFEGTTPHSLRRTTASLLLAADPKRLYEVSRMLGHSSVSITEKAYLDRRVIQPDLTTAITELYGN
jgi:integrase